MFKQKMKSHYKGEFNAAQLLKASNHDDDDEDEDEEDENEKATKSNTMSNAQ